VPVLDSVSQLMAQTCSSGAQSQFSPFCAHTPCPYCVIFPRSISPAGTPRSHRTPVASCQCCACVRRQRLAATLQRTSCHFPPSFSSSPLMRAANSGRRPYHANNSLNFCKDRAGVPQAVSPLRIVFPPNTPLCPQSPHRLPVYNARQIQLARPLPRAFQTRTSRTNPPAPRRPVCAPILQLCPTWTRLSSFTPSPMRVSSSEPRSMVVFAPIPRRPQFPQSPPAEISNTSLPERVTESVRADHRARMYLTRLPIVRLRKE